MRISTPTLYVGLFLICLLIGAALLGSGEKQRQDQSLAEMQPEMLAFGIIFILLAGVMTIPLIFGRQPEIKGKAHYYIGNSSSWMKSTRNLLG